MESTLKLRQTDGIDTVYCGSEIIDDVKRMYTATPYAGRFSSGNSFGIHLTDTDDARRSVSTLINRMYAWRGYTCQPVEAHPSRITLAASGQGRVIGTVTLGVDSSAGILADEVFKVEIDAFRKRGAKVCEVSKLAIDPAGHPKIALASLFHILYIYARKIHQCTDAFIEVNPRHRHYYESMLGFQSEAEVRENPRVNAPASLLRISLDYMGAQIDKLGGSHAGVSQARSLYPYFFGSSEETGISARLMEMARATN